MPHPCLRSLRSLGLATFLVSALGAAHASPMQPPGTKAGAGGKLSRAAAANIYLQWMRAAPLQPSTVWIGGTLGCANPDESDTLCPGWAMGSTNGGRTWHDATGALTKAAQDTGSGCTYTRTPAVLDGPGRQIAVEETGGCASASSSYVLVLYSNDGGKSWTAVPPSDTGGYGAGTAAPAFAPVAPYQAWMVDIGSDGDSKDVARLVRGTLQDGTNPASAIPGSQGNDAIVSLVPDPRGTAGVFANASGATREYVAYSADRGKTWRLVDAPAGVKSFAVVVDPLVAGGLVATASDKKFPPDRRWYSTDGGSHWTAGVCAGDYKAICPRAILPTPTLGGASVAINVHGAYTFTGDAGASGHATISLPVPESDVLDAQGDLKPGDPIYLLTGAHGRANTVYRSLNGGATWATVSYPTPHAP